MIKMEEEKKMEEIREIEDIKVYAVDTDKLKIHSVFSKWFPRASSEVHVALRHDIQLNKQQVPIEINKDLEILDGYNRWAVLRELRIPKTKVVYKVFKTKEEERRYVFSKNFPRRDLNTWQRIVVVLKLIENQLKEEKIDTPLEEYLKRRGRPSKKSANLQNFRVQGIAEITGLSTRTVEYALRVYFEGDERLHKKLNEGKISILQAYNIVKPKNRDKQMTEHLKKIKRETTEDLKEEIRELKEKVEQYRRKACMDGIITVKCPHCNQELSLYRYLPFPEAKKDDVELVRSEQRELLYKWLREGDEDNYDNDETSL
jgi:ParB-like chromosome segregation protein Spo0J